MAFPDAWLSELLSKNDIASVISEYTELRPKGGRLWGHCPFHTDKTPSFSVSPDKQLFHCFSCKAGGSVIQFIMQAENLSYFDAVRHLASRANMDMPEEINDRRLVEQKLLRERIYEANRETANFYYRSLFSEAGGGARRYLEARGVNADTAKRFGLGYSPDGYDVLYKHLTEKGFSRDVLLSAGLVVKGRKDETKTYDFFRGRLMFPVVSASGKVIAFGGRTMAHEEPKYINTGDTPVYNKRENIYAINLLKGKKLDDIIMVEGYMDVISLHQAGVENTVASLGTALTNQQARLLKRYASKIFYAYDGDDAGQNAMIRGIDILRSAGMEPRVIVIPGGKDPDEYIKEFGRDEFMILKDASITGIRFKLSRLAAKCGTDTADGRQQFAIEACSLISKLEPVERDRYIPYVSETSGLSAATIREQCGLSQATPSANDPEVVSRKRYVGFKRPKRDSERTVSEKRLLSCIMSSAADGLAIARSKLFSLMLFTSDSMRVFAARLISEYESGKNANIPLMLAGLDAEGSEDVSSAYAQADSISDPVPCAEDIMLKLTVNALKDELSELSKRSAGAGSADEKERALNEYKEKYAFLQNLLKTNVRK
ncbi:MAG: DNA primase [Clostridiales bacterium]|nr:DNA primase [Clostridiales bacterium]